MGTLARGAQAKQIPRARNKALGMTKFFWDCKPMADENNPSGGNGSGTGATNGKNGKSRAGGAGHDGREGRYSSPKDRHPHQGEGTDRRPERPD